MTTAGSSALSLCVNRSAAVRLAMAAASGLLLACCFPLADWNFLVWVAGAPLILAALHQPRLGRAYFLGAFSGAIFLTASVYWFVGVMQRYGQLPLGVAIAAMVPFLIVFSSFWGVFSLAIAWAVRRSAGMALLLAPVLWVALELARTYYFISGFPWNLLGYAVKGLGLRQIAAYTAVYGLSFLAAATQALVVWVALKPKAARLAAAAIWVLALVGLNRALQPPPAQQGRNLAVLVQPNVPLDDAAEEAWAPWRNPAKLDGLVRISIEALRQHAAGAVGAPLVIWAENPAPFFYGRDAVFTTAVQNLARAAQAEVITNTITFQGGDERLPRNSAVVLDPQGNAVLRYDKIHLVPFGEYVPAWVQIFGAGKITSQVGDFVPGAHFESAATPQGRAAIFICYEAIFPQLVRKLADRQAGVLVNISNDAWYGDSAARFQHLMMARFRAIENHRFLLRSTNDGVTCVVDPYGRVIASIPEHQQLALAARFDYLTGSTFYGRHGDVFAWACVFAAGVIALLIATRSGVVHRTRG